MHADAGQVEMILALAKEVGLNVKDTMSYQEGLWEVITVEWLQNVIAPMYEPSDIISYCHCKGLTHNGEEDCIRDYLMDYLFVNYEANLKMLNNEPKFQAAVCCATMDMHLNNLKFFYSFWTAKVGHVLSIPPPDREDLRWASEWFLKIELGKFFATDSRICIHEPGCDDSWKVPRTFIYGIGWKPSEMLSTILKPIREEFKHDSIVSREPPTSTPSDVPNNHQQKKASTEKRTFSLDHPTTDTLHIIYGSVVGILMIMFLVFLVLYLKARRSY
jgi:hypothetical protein